ncbi:MAG: hypothetical protein ACREMG_06785, partial [Gemmatimonadales bacterium]
MNPPVKSRLARLGEDPVVRVAAYYVLLAAMTALVWRVFPGIHTVFSAERLDVLAGAGAQPNPLLQPLESRGEVMAPPMALAITTAL